jgi:hypothetical protein
MDKDNKQSTYLLGFLFVSGVAAIVCYAFWLIYAVNNFW